MILLTAILQSTQGLALRRHIRPGVKKPEYHMAVQTKKNVVYILNGHLGTMRRITTVDQLQDDWFPFQERLDKKGRVK